MERKNKFIARNTVFGLFVGLSYIAAGFVFYQTGRGLSLNPQLNNVIMLLGIIGAFIGARKYRQEELGGYMGYGAALGCCFYIMAVGTVLYGMYVYSMYSHHPELKEQYLLAVNQAIGEVYKGSSMLETLQKMMKDLVSPGFITMAEIFNKLFTGALFSLFLAGLVRRKNYGLQNN